MQYKMDVVFRTPSCIDDEFARYTISVDKSVNSNDSKTNKEQKHQHAGGYSDSSSSNNNNSSSDSSWLFEMCSQFAKSRSSVVLTSTDLRDEIIRIVHTYDKTEHESRLFELIGEDGFDFLIELMQLTDRIKCINIRDIATDSTTNSVSSIATVSRKKPLSINQMKKLERKENEEYQKQLAVIESMQDPSMMWLKQVGFDENYLNQEGMLGLRGGSSSSNSSIGNVLDHWKDNLMPEGSTEINDKAGGLPSNAERKVGPGFEEIFIPAPKKLDKPTEHELIAIDTLESWAQLAFPKMKTLNRIQSKVFNIAYNTNDNMLVCAPTGAGKTNIAMLTFLQLVKQHISDGDLDKKSIKCIYIAPMKALAQEVVTKFNERLEPLGLIVREFTGDMQLNRQEIIDSQILVTTPEKYDVITRKGGDGSLGTLVNLIIIDEVHLLADDRGAVIETIVARTQRYIESSQKLIRIVGLSATLPNYKDVATFLHVNHATGLFHFGPQYRPVPLDMTFIGITEKQKKKKDDMMNQIAYEKMIKALERGKQVMIFVHSRKETSKTIEAMRDLSSKEAATALLENIHHEQYTVWKRQVDKSRSVEVQQLFNSGLGVHHAGMLRNDRTMVEQLFECGLIKVLCCTATLAWGVNLPAHTVIIKGTELYDPERGGFVDLSVLDVLQIFGRAGRPQYDNTGHALLITPQKTFGKYLSMLGHQAPIESSFIKALPDHMNAEIVNGTINNIKEASSWLSYTFLYVRMSKNPLCYGLTIDDKYNDPQLDAKRIELVKEAAEKLDTSMMIRYDVRTGNLAVTDLGRIASHYYIKYGTIEAFNAMLTAHLNDSEALHVLCSSAEFDQLKLRPEELPEIDELRKTTTIQVKGGSEDTSGKVSILLQGYINSCRVTSFTLQSDMNYVAQNAGRITRALFEVCLKRGWSVLSHHYLTLAKCIDRKIRVDHTPLRQFYDDIPEIAIKRIEETKCDIDSLLDMKANEVGQLCHSQKHGAKILMYCRKLPYLDVQVSVQPLTRGILRISLSIVGSFDWSDRYHDSVEAFWIWIEDGENECIYHSEYFLLHKKQLKQLHSLEFTIPIREPLPTQYYIRVISDRWIGCDQIIPVSFQHLILPTSMPPHTNLLDIHPVPKSALNNELYESMYSFTHFNPLQSQTFYTLYHTDNNILIGAPTGCGKTVTAELTILRLFNTRPSGAKVIYIAPLKSLARERLFDWKRKFGSILGLSVLELTGDVTPDMHALKRADILIVTPEKWDSISRGWQKRQYVSQVELVIIDEIHLLGEERGPVLEVIVTRMRFISSQTSRPIRFVGLSTALANPRDLADWMGIREIGVYNFRPSVRPIPMTIHIQGFPGKHYCPRMATMNKPAYAAIAEHSPAKPVLIFVSSRRQTRLTALDMISYCASDDNPKRYLHISDDEIEAIAYSVTDSALKNTLLFGIGIHHAGLNNRDRSIVEELFLSSKIQVLICTATLAWGVNLPCHLVIIKGTEFFDGKLSRYIDSPVTDVLQMIGRAGRPQFDDTGVACVFVHEPKKNFYRKFLHEPFPVESSLHMQLHNHFNAEINNFSIRSVSDCTEYISWTYYFRRLLMNPCYYGLNEASPEGVKAHLDQLIGKVLGDLMAEGCIDIEDGTQLSCTMLGKIASFYYLDYRTVGLFQSQLGTIGSGSSGSNSADISKVNASVIGELLQLLCNSHEFDEVPVRHNEDLLNIQLAELLLPMISDWAVLSDTLMKLDMSSSHTKTLLLLLAHFYHVALPISDYVIDTKLVLDQAPRVLNALIDIAADNANLQLVMHLVCLSQMIYQAAPVYRPMYQLLQLPHVSTAMCQSMQMTLHDVLHDGRSLSNLKKAVGGDHAEVCEVLSVLPRLSLDISIGVQMVASTTTAATATTATDSSYVDAAGAGNRYTIKANSECKISITIINSAAAASTSGTTSGTTSVTASGSTNRNSKNGNRKVEQQSVYAPHYHRPKMSSYWLILGTDTGELVSFKRISNIPTGSSSSSRSSSEHVTFSTITHQDVTEKFTLMLYSDSVSGLEAVSEFQVTTV